MKLASVLANAINVCSG